MTRRLVRWRAGVYLITAVLAVLARVAPVSAAGATTVRGFDRIVTFRELSFVNAIAQADDGWLWLATESGVIRFDGVRFYWPGKTPEATRRDALALPAEPVSSLALGSGGAMWFAYSDGRIERRVPGRARERETFALDGAGLASNGPTVLARDAVGTIWIARDGGRVWRGDESDWPPRVFKLEGGVTSARLLRDQDGAVWARTNLGWRPLSRAQAGAGDSTVCTGLPVEALLDDVVHCLFPRAAPPRGVFTGTAHIQGMEIDRSGRLWISTSEGLLGYDEGKALRLSRSDGLAADSMPAMARDRDGNLWLGSHGAGLTMIATARFRTWGRDENLGGSVAFSVTPARDGGLWASTTDGLVWLGPKDRRFWLYRDRMVPEPALRSLLLDALGALWTFSEGSTRILRLEGDRVSAETLPSQNVAEALAEDSSGNLWIGTRRGSVIRRPRGNLPAQEYAIAELCPIGAATCAWGVNVIEARRAGGLWIGTMNRGVFVLNPETAGASAIQPWAPGSDLAGSQVFDFFEDEQGKPWIATDRGLFTTHDGKLRSLGTSDGLAEERVFSLLDDGSGRFWFTGERGISWANKAELRGRLAGGPPVAVRTYTVGDGLNSNQGFARFEPESARTGDGRLWFATLGGLVEFSAPATWPAVTAPPVSIESVDIDGVPAAREGEAALIGGPGRGDLTVRFTTPHFLAPERVQFRHRLQPLETTWSRWSLLREARYTNLAPGAYTIEIQAQVPDATGLATVGAALVLTPRWFQRIWVRVLGAILLLALAVLAQQAWTRRVRLADRRVVQERSRIARDLHDSLAQVFSAASFQLDAIGRDTDRGNPLRDRLDSVQRTIAQARFTVRSAIQNLRSETLATPPFEQGLQAVAALYGDARIKVIVTGAPRPVPPRLQSDLLFLTQEAVSNAIEHGQAGHVGIEVVFGERLELWIRDDGSGFDPQALTTREGLTLGLSGMKERVAQLNGVLHVHSVPGAGTEIGVTIDNDTSPGRY